MANILAFETSCDDTAVAIINDTGKIFADLIYSQNEEQAPYGGVVPEIGSRSHIEQILPLTKKALLKASLKPKDIDIVAATFGPGLIGPLLVGAQFAKGISLALNVPLIAVHHIEGHILASYKEEGFIKPPFLSLIVSGGHTAIYECDEHFNMICIGQTIDDAAGETLDKIGRALGFPYPSGKIIDDTSLNGDENRFSLPMSFIKSAHYDFSFSGLKTAALRLINSISMDEKTLADFCASLQKAIFTPLCQKLIKKSQEKNIKNIVIGGGVCANSYLRHTLSQLCDKENINLFLPDKRYCTDNAVMIAKAALLKWEMGLKSPLDLDVLASISLENKHKFCS